MHLLPLVSRAAKLAGVPVRHTATDDKWWHLPPVREPQARAGDKHACALVLPSLIERYALRELPADEVQRVEEHIAACPDCEDRLQDEVELPVAMSSWKVAEVRRIVEAGRKKAAKR